MKDCQFKSDRLVGFLKRKVNIMKFPGYTHASLRNVRTRLVYLRRNGFITVEQFDKAINQVEIKGLDIRNKSYTKRCNDANEAFAFAEELESKYKHVFWIKGPLSKLGDGVYTWEVR